MGRGTWRRLTGCAVAGLALGGCLQPETVDCGDGRVCPAGTLCDDIHGACVFDTQLTECQDLAEDDRCPIPGSSEDGVCHDDVCLPIHCGDGFIDGAEDCEGGDLGGAQDCTDLGYYGPGTLACAEDCTYGVSGCVAEGRCGDGTVDDGFESCDRADLNGNSDCLDLGYYHPGPLSCTDFCLYNTSGCSGSCGDGTLEPPEQCEDTWQRPEQCVDFGFGAGRIGCNADLCQPSFTGCGAIGWQRYTLPVAGSAGAVWGLAADDVWAGVGSTMLHFDGIDWTVVDTSPYQGTISHIGGSAADDVWVVGADGLVGHWNGDQWSAETVPASSDSFLRVWVNAPDDVWAFGSLDFIHRDADGWSVEALPCDLRAIWGAGPGDLWAACAEGNVLHRQSGGGWAPSLTSADPRFAIWGSSATDIWAGGESDFYHYDGSGWSLVGTQPFGEQVLALVGVGRDAMWAMTNRRRILRYDGRAWSDTGAPANAALLGVVTATEVWVESSLGLHRYPGAAWAQVDTWPVTDATVWIAGGSGADDVWRTINDGADSIQQFDGTWWRPGPDTSAADGAWAAGPGEAWLAGDDLLRHFDGTVFDRSDAAPNASQVWGSGPDDVWAVGDVVSHFTGASWSTVDVSSTGLIDVWGSRPGDIWLVGQNGAIHGDGTDWQVELLSMLPIVAVWGSGPDDVWIVGANGLVDHWDGSSLTPYPDLVINDAISDVWGTGPDDVWIGTSSGRLFQYDGVGWAEVRSPTDNIASIWGTPGHIYVSDSDGRAFALDRAVRWTCAAAETQCGDGVDDDCDGLIDGADAQCAEAVRLAEVSLGATGGFLEVFNRSSAPVNLVGLELVWEHAGSGFHRHSFGADAIVPAGQPFRLVEGRDVGERERWLDEAMSNFPDASGWAALCAGPCDLGSCSNVLDVVAQDGGGLGPIQPACISSGFGPTAVDVSGAGPGDAVVRTAYTGAGVTSDWTVAPATRD